MFIPRIYYPHPLQVNTSFRLDKETHHYLMKVLRLKHNEKVILFTGQEGEYLGELKTNQKDTEIKILSFTAVHRCSPLQLHLGQALLRGDKMDLVIQKATELGITSITPLISANGIIKLDEDRAQKRLAHWTQIAISAAEQSGRTDIPHIHVPVPLADWVGAPFAGLSVVFEPESTHTIKTLAPSSPLIRFAIGPESGWQAHELNLMTANHFTSCKLGPRILRTETAGIAVISIFQMQWGDL